MIVKPEREEEELQQSWWLSGLMSEGFVLLFVCKKEREELYCVSKKAHNPFILSVHIDQSRLNIKVLCVFSNFCFLARSQV